MLHIGEVEKRQRKPKSADYRDAWHLIPQWAVQGKRLYEHLTNSGKPLAG